jgi:O-antigen/teichoic acid export membrane protein
MLSRLLKHTAVYGVGTASQSLLMFLLLPVYTRLLPQHEYGAFALLLGVLYLGDILFRGGVAYAYLTLAGHEQEPEARRRLGRSAWTLLLVQALAAFLLLLPVAPHLDRWVTGGSRHGVEIRLILLHLLLSTPVVAASVLLRSADRPKLVVALNLAQLAISCACGLGFVALLGRGVRGAFEGYVAGALAAGVPAAVMLLRRVGLGVDSRHRSELHRLGMSYALGQLLTLLFAYASRALLLALSSLRDVALYDLAHKIGMVVSLIVGPFSVTWTTGLFEVARSERPQQAFVGVFKGLMAALAWAGLGLSLFAREILLVLGGRAYQDAAPIVPLVVTAFVLSGAYSFFAMGPALKKSSSEMLGALAAGLAASALVNAALTPRLGLLGAASAALVASAAATVVMFRGAQRCYPLDYPWPAVLKLGVLYLGSIGLGMAATAASPLASAAARLLLFSSFPLQLLGVAFFDAHERASLRRLPLALLARRAEPA